MSRTDNKIAIPPGAARTFWNAGEGKLRFLADVTISELISHSSPSDC